MKKILIFAFILGIAVAITDYFFPFYGVIVQPLMSLFWPVLLLINSAGAVFFVYRILIVLSVIALSLLVYYHIVFIKNRSKLWYLIFVDLLIILFIVYYNYNINRKDYCDGLINKNKAVYHECLINKMRETNDPYYCPKFSDVYLQDVCYKEIALNTRNFDLCDKMSLSPSQFERDMCFNMAALYSHNTGYCEKIYNEKAKKDCVDKKAPWY